MSQYVKGRDGHITRMPISCATHLELDHVIPHQRDGSGGSTTAANLACLGQRDHHLKTDGGLTITGDANTTLTITTKSGATYPSEPHQYADPCPPEHDPPPF